MIVNNGAGVLPSANWYSTKHTKTLVPLYVKGLESKEFSQYISGNEQKYGMFLENKTIFDILTIDCQCNVAIVNK